MVYSYYLNPNGTTIPYFDYIRLIGNLEKFDTIRSVAHRVSELESDPHPIINITNMMNLSSSVPTIKSEMINDELGANGIRVIKIWGEDISGQPNSLTITPEKGFGSMSGIDIHLTKNAVKNTTG